MLPCANERTPGQTTHLEIGKSRKSVAQDFAAAAIQIRSHQDILQTGDQIERFVCATLLGHDRFFRKSNR
jgi:hypothetical protein